MPMPENHYSGGLQDEFLDNLLKNEIPAAIYLKSGIKLSGKVIAFDAYTISLQEHTTQLIFKHAIATILPTQEYPGA